VSCIEFGSLLILLVKYASPCDLSDSSNFVFPVGRTGDPIGVGDEGLPLLFTPGLSSPTPI
jgi:hypothetical protein